VVAQRIRAAVCEPISSAAGAVQVGVSIGRDLVRGGELSATDLLARADAAMYADKRHRHAADPERGRAGMETVPARALS
jgi:GGDEF domain-containing protein